MKGVSWVGPDEPRDPDPPYPWYWGECSICHRKLSGPSNTAVAKRLLDHLIDKHPNDVGAGTRQRERTP